MKINASMLWFITMACLISHAQAATVWDEASNGDFSNSGLSPTSVNVATGSNVVIGSTGNAGQGIDRDYFRITVPAGTELSSIMLLGNTSVSGGSSFIGMQAGSQVTVSPTGAGVENLIGLGHYGNDQIGTDILPAIEVNRTGPFPSGTYSIWVQDTGGPATYGFDFVITAAPAAAMADAPLPEWAYALLAVLLLGSVFGAGVKHRVLRRAR